MGPKRKKRANETLTVGLGASAGGLEPLKQFFSDLPGNIGIAFIVIMHLSPDRESSVAKLLQSHTSLKVLEVHKRSKINPGHVYVITPGTILSIDDNHLVLSEPDREREGPATVDLLFRSLGKAKGKNASGIILSGSGSDGAVGIKEIKEQGGLTIAQKPGEAEFRDMPQSAIEAGAVDLVLSVKSMAGKLLDYQKNLFRVGFLQQEDRQEMLTPVFKKLRSEIGHDFSYYKKTTLRRRIERRMQINNCVMLDSYIDYLDKQPEEIEKLFGDLLISVTSFFRNPGAFESINNTIIPGLVEDKGPKDQHRIWVPGCATGEEAYSIAILLQEYARQTDREPEAQIFASDINREVLMYGRRGIYPQSIEVDVSDSRLNQYFEKTANKYQLKPEIANMVLFAQHDLLRDPPFSNLDLVACRNLLIYLKREIQSEVFNLFQYVLNPGGYLFLGMSDSDLKATELFKTVDKKHRIYRKDITPDSHLSLPKLPLRYEKDFREDRRTKRITPQQKLSIKEVHQDLLIRLYAPQSVIIDEEYEVIHATEGIDAYLEYGGGEPSANILSMIIPELREVLRSLLYDLEHGDAVSVHKKAIVGSGEGRKKTEVIVHRFNNPEFPESFIHVVFKAVDSSEAFTDDKEMVGQTDFSTEEFEIIERLEKELQDTHERLHITVEEYETANEELRSSNEELQSTNEELHSATEELETSQDELKSVNLELENKIEKINQVNSDLKNLMKVAEVAILFVDKNFNVQRFTESAADIFNLIPSDKGRPLKHMTHRLDYDHLSDDLDYVYNTLNEIKKVVSSTDDHIYMMRLCPYRSVEDKVEGVVLTFMDVTQLKEAEENLQQQKLQESLARMGTYALGIDNLDLIIQRALQQACLALNADYSVMFNWHSEENSLKLAKGTGYDWTEEGEAEIEADPKWDIGYTLMKESPTVVSNYADEDRFKILSLLNHLDIQSGVNVKVTESDEVCGILGFYSKNRRVYSKDELNFIEIASNIIGMASESAKNKKSLEEANKRLEEEVERCEKYQKEILQSSIAERWDLGGYLHDNLAQTLVSIKIMVKSMGAKLENTDSGLSSQVDLILENIDESITSIRNLTHEIIPIDIEEGGVKRALRLLVRQLKNMHNVNCKLKTDDIIEKVNDKKVATNLYHIIQEAVKNAAIHGKADSVNIQVMKESDLLKLQITDDGIGLSKAESKGDGGSGTNIMRHRIELLGGSFDREEISDRDKTGTRVTCTLPLERLYEASKSNG